MVERQLEARGIKDRRVLEAMRDVPRHLFVLPAYRERAYEDCPLPIDERQTISQPYMVAWMTELLCLKGDETVLEIGTGSGYQAAVLSKLARFVYTVERIPALAESARERLRDVGITNVEVVVSDGTEGLPEHAPYEGIIVTAGSPSVPPLLVEQLGDRGRLVIPVGSSGVQMLTVIEKRGDRTITSEEGSCVFVPLVGKYGWER
ncbi:MAG: protein-L-isoaspartate(D-aspartate) O-methyltransferase [Actinobacteria bacterium]|nr:protein-L-isoaspartate(D-aspartate) O-methyltransferase [Actinomycetota bacterium]